jgi:hypothetical protein
MAEMTSGQVIAPSATNYISLARTKQGKLFRKPILKIGDKFTHPANPKNFVTVTPHMASTMVRNFEKSIIPIVQFPKVGQDNAHSEDPTHNLGEVIGLEIDGQEVVAVIDVRKSAEDVGSTILGASAMIDLDRLDTRSGQRVGPTLIHVAATNNPHVTNLGDYREIIAASAELEDNPILLATEQREPDVGTFAQQIADLLGLDVPDDPDEGTILQILSDAVAAAEDEDNEEITAEEVDEILDTMSDDEIEELAVELGIEDDEPEYMEYEDTEEEDMMEPLAASALSQIASALGRTGTLKLSSGQSVTPDDVVGAIVELSDQNANLGQTVLELATKNAENEIDGLVRLGYILPAQRDTMVRLSMTDRQTYEELLPAQPIIDLSYEDGVGEDDTVYQRDMDDEIQRIVEQHKIR